MIKSIIELNNSELKNYRLLGRACSESFKHCFYMGEKNKEGFKQRVVGYRQVENDKVGNMLEEKIGAKMITIEFYENKDTTRRDELIRQSLNNAKEDDEKYGKLVMVEIANDIITMYRNKNNIITKQVSKIWQADERLTNN
jgi:hypothetical protein